MRLTISRTTDSLDELTRADGANPPRLGPEPAGVFVAEQEGLGSAAAIGILRGSKQSDLPARGHGALEVAEANQDPQRGHPAARARSAVRRVHIVIRSSDSGTS